MAFPIRRLPPPHSAPLTSPSDTARKHLKRPGRSNPTDTAISHDGHYGSWMSSRATARFASSPFEGAGRQNSGAPSVNASPSTTKLVTKAGEDGYSLLRRPLTWDSDSDPFFDAPTRLKEDDEKPSIQDQKWFETKRQQQNKTKRNKDISSDDDVTTTVLMDGTGGVLEQPQNVIESWGNNGPLVAEEEEFKAANNALDLHQRTLSTLDYPLVLKALKEQCDTVPARRIVENSISFKDKKGESNLLQSDRYLNNMQVLPQGQKESKRIHSPKRMHAICTMGLTANNVSEVHERYRAVKEMKEILQGNAILIRDKKDNTHNRREKEDKNYRKIQSPPLKHPSFDLQPMWDKIDAGGVLDGPDILEVRTIMGACRDVSDWCQDLERATTVSDAMAMNQRAGSVSSPSTVSATTTTELQSQSQFLDDVEPSFVQIPEYGKCIDIDSELLELLELAFDQEGRLSGTTFQGIGRLRAKVRSLKANILSTLDKLLSTPSIKSKVSLESGGALYSEVRGRIVIPISEQYANSVGVVHDMSRSGKTAYIEPTEIVKPTNEMNQAIMELNQEENKVWRMLTNKIIESRDEIDQSVAVVAQLDLVLARIRLGDRIAGVIPEVRDEGIISLKNAKHPVLLLRDIKNVVGSDIDIGSGGNQGLILTGPNSGGKTVILKLLGLCALMARDGIPVPAYPDGARIDFFNPVLADIGDLQSVGDDLSTFSGHMLVCREVLASSCRNALVLMDELGSGTDPNQGVAIAQAILEALLTTGSRVAITTHYLQLKQLAASDERFSVGAMQFINGKPTYKLLPGIIGESFALSVAERLKLPQSVIDRASELMDSDTQQMGELIKSMEDQKALIDKQYLELQSKKKELEDLEQKMKIQQQKIEREQINARRTEAAKFAKKLEEKERILENVLNNLKNDPSKKLIVKSWDEIKYVKRDAFVEAENIPSMLRLKEVEPSEVSDLYNKLVPIAEMRNKPDLNPGDRLIVCKTGALRGKEAIVVSASGKKVDVTVQGMQLSMKLSELSLAPLANSYSKSAAHNDDNSNPMSKWARKALEAEKDDFTADLNPSNSGRIASNSIMRLSSNTVDCLGCNFEEAKRKCEDMFSKVMMQKHPVVFILHGHGSKGVLKTKIREWLGREKQFVKKFGPADSSDGGDAFTKVELKNSIF